MTKKIIMDGDWGGDEMQLAAVLLAATDTKILGATTTFGNTALKAVVRNAGSILHFLKADEIPYYIGAAGPTGKPSMRSADEGDGAHGEDGKGGADLDPAIRSAENESAVEFILNTLRKNPPGTITITATGPLTNIAQAIAKDREAMSLVKEIVIMGGCTEKLPAADMDFRQGNITPYAEFNFYMAPEDAANVMTSGLPIVLCPMNLTQQMSVTPERQKMITRALFDCGNAADKVLKMMCAPEPMDRAKFDDDPFMHDIQTGFYLVSPHSFSGRHMRIEVTTVGEKAGMTTGYACDENDPNSIIVLERIINPDRLFSILPISLQSRLSGPRPIPEPFKNFGQYNE